MLGGERNAEENRILLLRGWALTMAWQVTEVGRQRFDRIRHFDSSNNGRQQNLQETTSWYSLLKISAKRPPVRPRLLHVNASGGRWFEIW